MSLTIFDYMGIAWTLFVVIWAFKKMFTWVKCERHTCGEDLILPSGKLKGQRLRELNSKTVPTMEELNEKRMLIGYPHLIEIVKEKCPKCGSKMWHDQFQKCWDKNKHLKACYECVDCNYRVLFDLFTNKFDKKPFGEQKGEENEI